MEDSMKDSRERITIMKNGVRVTGPAYVVLPLDDAARAEVAEVLADVAFDVERDRLGSAQLSLEAAIRSRRATGAMWAWRAYAVACGSTSPSGNAAWGWEAGKSPSEIASKLRSAVGSLDEVQRQRETADYLETC